MNTFKDIAGRDKRLYTQILDVISLSETNFSTSWKTLSPPFRITHVPAGYLGDFRWYEDWYIGNNKNNKRLLKNVAAIISNSDYLRLFSKYADHRKNETGLRKMLLAIDETELRRVQTEVENLLKTKYLKELLMAELMAK